MSSNVADSFVYLYSISELMCSTVHTAVRCRAVTVTVSLLFYSCLSQYILYIICRSMVRHGTLHSQYIQWNERRKWVLFVVVVGCLTAVIAFATVLYLLSLFLSLSRCHTFCCCCVSFIFFLNKYLQYTRLAIHEFICWHRPYNASHIYNSSTRRAYIVVPFKRYLYSD